VTITDRPPTEISPETPQTRRGPSMPQVVGGGVLVLIGALWLLERTGVIDVSVTAVLALATMVIGISLILLARDGPHVGLIIFGSILALVTLLTAAAPFEGFQGGVGDRTFEVSAVDDIRADYNLAMGKLTIDLRDLGTVSGPTELTASVGMGELIVVVPADVAIEVDARVGAGQLQVMDRTTDGVGINETYRTPGFAASQQRLSLELQAFTGRVEVRNG
jgi:hypothetical protein